MADPTIQAVVLGALQGLTEFLPVSSSGHLALGQMLFGTKDAGLTLSVMLHAGTLGATALLVRRVLARATMEGLRALRQPSRFKETEGGRDVAVVILASIPTAILGLLLRDTVDRWTGSPLAVGVGFLATGALLVSTLRAPRGAREVPTWLGAVLVGVAQGLAVVPGISRSGSTIAAALWLGVKPQRAFELSMLMSLPAVLGAVILEARHLSELQDPVPALIGAAVAFLVGLGALLALERVVIAGRFAWFALWVVPAALLTFSLLR